MHENPFHYLSGASLTRFPFAIRRFRRRNVRLPFRTLCTLLVLLLVGDLAATSRRTRTHRLLGTVLGAFRTRFSHMCRMAAVGRVRISVCVTGTETRTGRRTFHALCRLVDAQRRRFTHLGDREAERVCLRTGDGEFRRRAA